MNEPGKLPAIPSEIKDPVERLKVVEKLLEAERERVAVRGYEVARLNPAGEWEQVYKGRPTTMCLQQFKADVTYLNRQHPNTLYQVRVIVSAQIPDLKKPAPPSDTPNKEPNA